MIQQDGKSYRSERVSGGLSGSTFEIRPTPQHRIPLYFLDTMFTGSRSYQSVPSSEWLRDDDLEPTNSEKAGTSPLGLENPVVKKWIFSPGFLLLSHIATSTFYLLIISTLWHQSSSLENCAVQLSTWCTYGHYPRDKSFSH